MRLRDIEGGKRMNNIKGIAGSLAEIVIGILLLISPAGFTTGIITAVGICMLAAGIFTVIGYFRTEAGEAAKQQLLLKGLAAVLAGAFCTFKAHWFIVTFPALSMIYGAAILVVGLGKVQLAFDMLRMKKSRWYLGLISAVISVICAVIILSDPFTSAAVMWMFTGITLIVEAIVDIVALIFSGRSA